MGPRGALQHEEGVPRDRRPEGGGPGPEVLREFKFIFINFNRGVLNNKNQIEYRKNLRDGSNDHGFGILKSSLMDLLLLAECDYLVLHNLSNMSRLALELAAARLQRVPP